MQRRPAAVVMAVSRGNGHYYIIMIETSLLYSRIRRVISLAHWQAEYHPGLPLRAWHPWHDALAGCGRRAGPRGHTTQRARGEIFKPLSLFATGRRTARGPIRVIAAATAAPASNMNPRTRMTRTRNVRAAARRQTFKSVDPCGPGPGPGRGIIMMIMP